jgi:hypothetical protein
VSIDEKQPARQPWEQREDESVQAFRAFTFYRDLGLERSLSKAYRASIGDQTGEKSANGTWDKWSREYDWVERSRAYDGHLDAVRRQARERRIAELEARRFDFEFENQERLETLVRELDSRVRESITDGFKETTVEVGPDGKTVVRREIKVKFPALGAVARAVEACNDTARQAVEGPRKKPEIAASPNAAEPDMAGKPGANGPNEFVWVAPPPDPAGEIVEEKPKPE